MISPTHVLSAGHCFDSNDNGTIDANVSQSTVIFNTSNPFSIGIESIEIHPDFSGFGNPSVNDDLAIVTLSQPAPANVPIYEINRQAFTSAERIVVAGFGRSGTGVEGFTTNASFTTRRVGQNVASGFFLDDEGSGAREVFLFDFDGPNGSTNTLGDGLTLGNNLEVTIGGGDSGGPSFLHNDLNNNNQIDQGELTLFGVNTFSRSLNSAPSPFFGSQAGGLVVSSYLDFIDGNVTTQSPAPVIGQSGVISITDSFQRFTFGGRSYDNPVVIAGPLSLNGNEAATVRIRNVNSTGFDIRIEEYDASNGIHVDEQVSVLVIESGNHVLDDGTVLQAGIVNGVNHTTTRTDFTNSFSSRPVLLAQVTSQNGASTVATRLNGVNREGFTARLQEQEAADNIHVGERLSFVAIERGRGTTSGNLFDVQANLSVSHQTETIDFRQDFNGPPALFANIQTLRGADTAALRYRNLTSNISRIFVQEEQSLDDEVAHTEERVGYLAIEPGLIRGTSGFGGSNSTADAAAELIFTPESNFPVSQESELAVNYVAFTDFAQSPHSKLNETDQQNFSLEQVYFAITNQAESANLTDQFFESELVTPNSSSVSFELVELDEFWATTTEVENESVLDVFELD